MEKFAHPDFMRVSQHSPFLCTKHQLAKGQEADQASDTSDGSDTPREYTINQPSLIIHKLRALAADAV